MAGVVHDQNLEKHIEKQMGCMAGFLQIFDRTQILTGKRLYSTKRLPPSTVIDACSEPERSMESPAISRELEKPKHARSMPSSEHFKQQQSPVREIRSPVPESPSKSPLPLPVFELKEGNKSSWKFCKESPRLSLDSRATFDARGSLKPKEIPTNAAILSISRCEKNGEETDESDKQRRSPSVIARLMGLEKLPEWESEQAKTPELRRSASESRASRDLLQYRFIDGVNFQLKQSQQQQNMQNSISSNVIIDGLLRDQTANGRAVDPKEYNAVRNARAEPARAPHRGIGQRKSFFDSADFFPEPKQTLSIYGEIEKRLKMRGIDEPSKDLETLKQILEALQLKGLLHSTKPLNQTNQRNFVYDRSFTHDESPIVLMKPVRSTAPTNRQGRYGYDSASNFKARPAARRESALSSDTFPAMSPRRDRPEVEHNVRNQNRGRSSSSPTRSESRVKSPNRRRPLTVETQRRASNNSIEQRRVSPVQSPKVSSRRNVPDQVSNPSPRNRKQPAGIYQKEEKLFVPAEDESSSISDSISTSSQTDTERSKLEDFKEGRNLLERCDKLLNSIAEMTATDLQPSPVSVLDSSFYKEESSPSPIMKRSVDFNFKDQLAELEDDIWSPAISPIQLKQSEENSDDCDYIYIADIIRACNYLPEDSDVFLLLEKQQYLKGRDTSKGSTLERKLVFDTIAEILNRKRHLPPWKAVLGEPKSILQQIWSEFKRIRERDASDDLLEVICGMLKKDLGGDAMNGWGDSPIEMSESVLDIERLIFKDLIGETIRDLAAFPGKCNHQALLPKRKLVF